MAFQSLHAISNPCAPILASAHARADVSWRAEIKHNGSASSFRVACSSTPAASASARIRRSANYQPNSWDYCSLQLDSTGVNCMEEVTATHTERLKEEARNLLHTETGVMAQLELVDALQNLGLAHHFHEEIKIVLGSIWEFKNSCTSLAGDLHATALPFRLFREHGFQVSEDVFSAFIDDKGHFKECVCNDHRGMLSLYEASHLAFEGEETLDRARPFTVEHLKLELGPHTDLQLRMKIDRSLELPSRWRSPRLDVKWRIEQYEKEGNVDPLLVQLAKLDFNAVQILHRNELNRMTRWWRDLGVADRLPFARDRLVECFFFAAGVVADPKLGYCREEITKVCNLITTLDDAYDIYGSLDELVLFTYAVNKWEISATEGFPEYLKTCFSLLYHTTNETVDNVRRRDGRDILPCLRKAWADLCNSFLVEAKWQSSGYIPTLEEYLDNGWISVSGHVILTHVFSFSALAEDTMKISENYPNFFRSSSIIFRLCNDLATSAAELARGDAPTSILCYMHEHGVTEEVARDEIKRLISETWKKLNKEVANCSPFLASLADSAISLARVAHCMYHKCDGIGAPDKEKKNQIRSTFLDPIVIT